MKSNIFIPKTLKVGFQKRDSTYTGKLAYIIYYDEKGTLRKEKSWEGWRNKSVPPEEFENTPTSGFVLNKKAGGYSTGWNHRQTYVRVYDPRGFEFEISVPNLLYILENTNSIKGKGLEGEFVYGWEGTELILLPVEAPDYKEISKYSNIIHSKTKFLSKDMIPGATYLSKDNEEYVYLGKFPRYTWTGEKEKGKAYFFATHLGYIDSMKNLNKFVALVSEDCVDNYADLMYQLEGNRYYSPLDPEKDEYVHYTLEEFEEKFREFGWGMVYRWDGEGMSIRRLSSGDYLTKVYSNEYPHKEETTYESLRDVYNALQPSYKREYLANGRLYKEDK